MSNSSEKSRAEEWKGGRVHGLGDITGEVSLRPGGRTRKESYGPKGRGKGAIPGESGLAGSGAGKIAFAGISDDDDDFGGYLSGMNLDAKSPLDGEAGTLSETEGGEGDLKPKAVDKSAVSAAKPNAAKNPSSNGGGGGNGSGGTNNGGAFITHFKKRTQGNPLLGSGLFLCGDIAKDKMDHGIPDTDEGTVYLGMAYSIAISGLAAPKCAVNDFQSLTITVKFPKKYSPETDSNDVITRGPRSKNGDVPSFIIGKSSEDECGTYGVSNIAHCPDAEEKELFNTIIGGENDYLQFYIDFLNAYQVKGLKPKNVKSYFSWLKSYNISGDYIASSFHKITGGTPQISADDDLRGMLRPGEWTTYRSTFATIVFVGKRFLEDLPHEFSFLVSTCTKAAVEDSCKHPYDEVRFRKISKTFLAYAYKWSVVCDMEIPGLYSGERAFNELSTVNQVSMTKILEVVRSRIKAWESSLLTNFTNGVNSIPSSLKGV